MVSGSVVGAIVGGAMAAAASPYVYMYAWAYAGNVVPDRPVAKVAIIVPAFNEAHCIKKTLQSLNDQTVVRAFPLMFDRIVVDNESTDDTAKVAEAQGWRVVSAKRGKLNARIAGMEATDAEIIYAADADTFYPRNVLNLHLNHYRDATVVAVCGPVVYEGLVGFLGGPAGYYWSVQHGQLKGCNSSYRLDAYRKCGGFNLNINQFSGKEVLQEEEFDFSHRLMNVGKVAFDMRATVISSMRSLYCPVVGRYRKECLAGAASCPVSSDVVKYCQEIGKDRF